MGNELLDLSTLSEDEIKLLREMTGSFEGVTSNIQKLGVNYEAEFIDEKDPKAKPITLPRGQWTLRIPVEDKFVAVFAEQAVFRPYVYAMRYQAYDDASNSYPLISQTFNKWGNAIVDTMGNEASSRKYKDIVSRNNPVEAKNVKCVELVYGTVSLPNAADMHGEKHEVVDFPCLFMAKGSGFMPVADAYKASTKSSSFLFQHVWTMTTRREKNGNVVFFIPDIKVSDASGGITPSVLEQVKEFHNIRSDEDSMVIEKYKTIAKVRVKDVDDSDLANDFGFNDPLPPELSGEVS